MMNHLQSIWTEIGRLAYVGGPVLWALCVLAFFIAYVLINLWRAMHHPETESLTPGQWLKILRKPEVAERHMPALHRSLPEDADHRSRALFVLSQSLFGNADRRFPLAFVMIGVAPLVGLLGTVTGLHTTFYGMGADSGVESPLEMMSRGIFEALTTTEMGLVIGVPTLVVCSWMKNRHDQHKMAFQKLESRLMQMARATSKEFTLA